MSARSILLALVVLAAASGTARATGEDPAAALPPPLRLVVFLVDETGAPRIADALTCPYGVRVLHATGTPNTLDWIRYSFTPHRADPAHHATLSF